MCLQGERQCPLSKICLIDGEDQYKDRHEAEENTKYRDVPSYSICISGNRHLPQCAWLPILHLFQQIDHSGAEVWEFFQNLGCLCIVGVNFTWIICRHLAWYFSPVVAMRNKLKLEENQGRFNFAQLQTVELLRNFSRGSVAVE